MAKKPTKEELKNPDIFITFSDRAAQFLHQYRAIIFVVVGALLFGSLSSVTYDWYKRDKESKAQTAFLLIQEDRDKIEEKLDKDKKKREEALGKSLKNKNKKLKLSVKSEKPDFEKTYSQIVERYKKFISSKAETQAASIAALDLAELYSSYKMYKDAIAVMDSIIHQQDPDKLSFGLSHFRAGTLKMNLKDYAASEAHFRKIISNKKQAYLHPEALIQLGICKKEQGQLGEAKVQFEKVASDILQAPVADRAKSYIHLLQMEEGKPN